jgi:hypothetical protein
MEIVVQSVDTHEISNLEKSFASGGDLMKKVRCERTFLMTIFFGFVLLLALPVVSTAQGRGRGRGHGPDWDKKCGKFVNCHDARDGRWDGRGPRRNADYRRNGLYVNRGGRVGYRSYNTNDYWRRRHAMYRRNSDINSRYRTYRRRY